MRNVTQILRAGSIWELLRRVPREWGPGGREYGRVSAHPERPPGASLASFWASRKKLAARRRRNLLQNGSAARAKGTHPAGRNPAKSKFFHQLLKHLPPLHKILEAVECSTGRREDHDVPRLGGGLCLFYRPGQVPGHEDVGGVGAIPVRLLHRLADGGCGVPVRTRVFTRSTISRPS